MLAGLTSEDDGVTLKDLEFIHLSLGQLNDRVVVLGRVLDLQLVGRLLLFKNSRRKIFLCSVQNIRVKNLVEKSTNALTLPSEWGS